MSNLVTLTDIKGDVGSKAGHTEPDEEMLQAVRDMIAASGLVIDSFVGHIGDDIHMIMSHRNGTDYQPIHQLGWDALMAAGDIAERKGYYGAYQDLIGDAPSQNLRGSGPGFAEITFDHNPVKENTIRPRESFLVFAADKCGPGMFNVPIGYAFMYPFFNGGLLLKQSMRMGFVMRIVDMDEPGDCDHAIDLLIPEQIWDAEVLLRDPDRFAIKAIFSRFLPGEQIASLTTTRLHNIAGVYKGKDDPGAIVRTQLHFPAPELLFGPWKIAHYTTGDAMGFHNRAMYPTRWCAPVLGDHCQPIVSCIGFSMNQAGEFSHSFRDFFCDDTWSDTRAKALMKSALLAEQGFHGIAIAGRGEQAYSGLPERENELVAQFKPETELQLTAN